MITAYILMALTIGSLSYHIYYLYKKIESNNVKYMWRFDNTQKQIDAVELKAFTAQVGIQRIEDKITSNKKRVSIKKRGK